MNPTRQIVSILRPSFRELAKPYGALRERLLVDARCGGVALVQRTYAQHFHQLVVGPRLTEYWRVARLVAHQRLVRIETDVQRRFPRRRFPTHPRSAVLALHRAFTRGRFSGGRHWRLTDHVWPSDAALRYQFLTTLEQWQRRSPRPSLTLHAQISTAGRNAQPIIDPTHKKIAYPFGEETADPVDLVQRAIDNIVVGRGEYYAAVGIRDLAREVDHLTSQTESQHQPAIIGWRWMLSPAHTERVCPSGECLTYSTEDVGHPEGAGVYFDEVFPQSHPNCWCYMDPVYATDDQLNDPEWQPPQPDDGYADRVRQLVEQFHPMLAAAA